MPVCVRDEYPRPDFVRDRWLGLNGAWRFAFDDADQGVRQGWFGSLDALPLTIQVPFSYQTAASGIGAKEHHSIVWYGRTFELPSEWLKERLLLHFGAVDYEATVWVNGLYAGSHKGGYVPFHLDVTSLVNAGENLIVVRVQDKARVDQPRGKQSAKKGPWGVWYTAVTGIWQSVWLEPVSKVHLAALHLVPDIDRECLEMKFQLGHVEDGLAMEAVVRAEGQVVSSTYVPIPRAFDSWSEIEPLDWGVVHIPVPRPHLWSPESPFLYDLQIRIVQDGEVVDEVRTYFGMRKVHTANGQFFLNNRPYYQRLVLDQGYWSEGLYTAPSVDLIRRDVELMKAMGFNGARKHQKIEEPYFYYFCDRLGLLVWSEMPTTYQFTESAAGALTQEWQQAVVRDRNHPCIVAWVPINESWGVDQLREGPHAQAEAFLLALYHATHALDGTRPVISNDGWQHVTSDLVTIHEYTQDADDMRRRLQTFLNDHRRIAFSHRLPILLPGYDVQGAPLLVTEFGGVKVEAQGAEGWGYGKAAADYDEMVERIRRLVHAILEHPQIVGYCYTQLTDVEQEVNGLLTMDHRPKVDPQVLRQVFRSP